MFAEEINAKIRNYANLINEREKQNDIKQQQKMERRIEKDSQYLWNKFIAILQFSPCLLLS